MDEYDMGGINYLSAMVGSVQSADWTLEDEYLQE